jgi:geranylgeranylglycerol-phosphate geranylgeranyltransferase
MVGGWVAKGIVFSPQLLLAGMIGFIVCAYGNIINDLKDIEIDKINNPDRPLPKGTVNEKTVTYIAVFFFLISILFSLSLGIIPLLLVLITLVLLYLYATYLKKTVLGNFVVAFIAGLTFIFGGLITKNPACLIPFVFAILIHTAREIIKDVVDIKGDQTAGVISLPIILGKEKSISVSVLLLAILCIGLPIPFIFKILTLRYMIMVLLFAYPIIFYAIFQLVKHPKGIGFNKISNLLKISMAFGLIAMIL